MASISDLWHDPHQDVQHRDRRGRWPAGMVNLTGRAHELRARHLGPAVRVDDGPSDAPSRSPGS